LKVLSDTWSLIRKLGVFAMTLITFIQIFDIDFLTNVEITISVILVLFWNFCFLLFNNGQVFCIHSFNSFLKRGSIVFRKLPSVWPFYKTLPHCKPFFTWCGCAQEDNHCGKKINSKSTMNYFFTKGSQSQLKLLNKVQN